MIETLSHLAFIGPGGPEILVIMLVLIMMFGAKDAPRILRKLNAMLSQIRNTADSFKREVMYGDITQHNDDDDYLNTYGDDEFEAMEEELNMDAVDGEADWVADDEAGDDKKA